MWLEDETVKPSGIAGGTTLDCPRCGETIHRILKGKVTGKKGETIECVVKCSECGDVRKTTVKRERPVSVSLIVSSEEESQRKKIELLPSEEVAVEDRMIVDGLEVEVSSIESGGKRVDIASAKEIDTLWTKRADKVKVKFSISKGPKTLSKEILAEPDEEFFVGDMVELGRMKVVIYRIKCKERMVRKGGAPALDIVRIYAKGIKEVWA